MLAFDSISAASQVTGTTNTFAFNNVAGNIMFVFGHQAGVTVDVITSVTYNGVALVKIDQTQSDATNRLVTLWAWDAVTNGAAPTGSHNVVVTHSVSVSNNRYFGVSYSGASLTDPTGATDTSAISGSTSTIDGDLTLESANSMFLMFIKDNAGGRTYSGSEGTMRINADAGGLAMLDSTVAPSGAKNIVATDGGGTTTGKSSISIELKAVAGSASSSPSSSPSTSASTSPSSSPSTSASSSPSTSPSSSPSASPSPSSSPSTSDSPSSSPSTSPSPSSSVSSSPSDSVSSSPSVSPSASPSPSSSPSTSPSDSVSTSPSVSPSASPSPSSSPSSSPSTSVSTSPSAAAGEYYFPLKRYNADIGEWERLS